MTIACSTSIFCQSSLEEALRGIRALGFDKIDLLMIDGWVHVNTTDLARDYAGTLARVDALLKQHTMTPIAVNSGVSPLLHDRTPDGCARREAEVKALIRFMSHYHIGVAAVQPRNPDLGRPRLEVLHDSAETVRDLIEMARGTGVTFALECHSGSIVETMDEVGEIMRLVPDLRFAYDPTHFVMSRVALPDTLPLLERSVQVHLRDAAPGAMQSRYGQGAVDFDWILKRLQERDYRGHFSIEYLEQKGEDLGKDVKRLHDKIAEYFER
jgi:sugar phosphate isomerase/epimerase